MDHPLLDLPEIPAQRSQPGTYAFDVDEHFVLADAVFVVGKPSNRQATIPFTGPDGLVARYRKTHLPFLGVDRFTAPGDEVVVADTPLGRIGIEICYDLRFPELTRALALGGAEIVVHPTNWPVQVRPLADFVTRARAAENRIFLLTANRVGFERDAEFFGWSQIVDPLGVRLAAAGAEEERLVVAEVDPAEAREKDILPVPGEYEIHLFDDRRPEPYGAVVEEPAMTSERRRT
jgi:predicted amidohydrolase